MVAKARNGVIGANGDLPWHIPRDLRHFKELTTGRTVVMGRKTYESIVTRLGHALPNRRNIVLTSQKSSLPDAEIIRSIDEIDNLGEVFIIGGARVYEAVLDKARRLYVTEIHADIAGDTYFPTIDKGVWREVSRESHVGDDSDRYDFDFVIYERQ